MQEKNPKNQSHDQRPEWLQTMGWFGLIVADLVGFVGAGLGLGYWLWRKQGLPVWVVIPTTLLGFVAAFYRIYLLEQRKGK